MAGGILSIAAGLAGQPVLSILLLTLAAVAFIVLASVDVVIAAIHRQAIVDPRLALVLFTWVAACGVLGDSRGPVPEAVRLGFSCLALAGWVLALVAVARPREPGSRGWRSWRVGGAWLLGVVATQSLAILAGAAAGQFHDHSLLAAGVALWMLGLVAYCTLIALIIRRLAGGAVAVDEFTPDYWIAMGALAISTVAALDLSRAAAGLDSITGLVGGLATAAAFTWVCGAGWIPYLCLVELVRARRGGLSLGYDASRWSTVFPLGMFSVASHELAHTVSLPFLGTIAVLALWLGVGLALMHLGRAVGALAGAAKRGC